jgi:hypothetical protein
MRLLETRLIPEQKVVELLNAEKIFALDLDSEESDSKGVDVGEGGSEGGHAIDEHFQKAALNGAQVASLIEVIQQISAGLIPKESAAAIIKAAFPTFDDVLISQIIKPISEQSNVDQGTQTGIGAGNAQRPASR